MRRELAVARLAIASLGIADTTPEGRGWSPNTGPMLVGHERVSAQIDSAKAAELYLSGLSL